MINDINIEMALDFIRDNSAPYAKAKADRIYLEQFRKSKKAMLVLEVDGTVQTREAYAYSHKDYIGVLDGLRVAVEIEECLKWKLIAAQTKTECWRTQQASARRQDRAHQ